MAEKKETLKLDYETELPPQPVSGQPFQLATFAQMHLLGRVNPAAAAQAFNKNGELSPREIAREIKDNMRGWLRYAAAEALKRELSLPNADPLGPVLQPGDAIRTMKELLTPVLGQWTFEIERLEVSYVVSESTMTALPGSFKKRLAFLAAEADTAVAFGPFNQDMDVVVPVVKDPQSGQMVSVSCNLRAIYTAHPEKVREKLDVEGGMSQGALGLALNENVRPWLEYAAKQAFYNALYEKDGGGHNAVRDSSVMRERVAGLCRDALFELGVIHVDVDADYSAMDDVTFNALQLSQTGEPMVARGGEQKESTIPIEEAVWRHQKAISKKEPNTSRREMAKKILEKLRVDGYSEDKRRKVGRQIGADPSDLP